AVRLPVREPRRRDRSDAAPPARSDLRVPVRAPDPRARAFAAEGAPRADRPRSVAGAARGRAARWAAGPLARRACGRARPGLRTVHVRDLDRADPVRAAALRRNPGRAARARAGLEACAAQARRSVAAPDAVPARLPPGT